MANTIKSRVLLKTDTTANWDKAADSFIPKKGEVCIYSDRFQLDDGSYVPGIKVGDGTSYINELEFMGDEYISNEDIDAIFAKLIKFYINSIEYTCEEGMTWELFVSSKYNDGQVKKAVSGSYSYVFGSSNQPIVGSTATATIIAGQNYSLGIAEPV